MRRYIISACLLSCLLVALAFAGEKKKEYFLQCQMIRDGKCLSKPEVGMIEGEAVSFGVAQEKLIAGQNVRVGAVLTATNSIQEGVLVLSGRLSDTQVVADSNGKDTQWGLTRSYEWMFSITNPVADKWYSSPEVKDGSTIKFRIRPASDSKEASAQKYN